MDLFGTFVETIVSLPVRAIIAMAERERKMIEDDISHKRPFPPRDTMSVLHFCRFIQSATRGLTNMQCVLPAEHFGIYRRIVSRLIMAGVLPSDALPQFDAAFQCEFLEEKWKAPRERHITAAA
jgi:hypothetical protein